MEVSGRFDGASEKGVAGYCEARLTKVIGRIAWRKTGIGCFGEDWLRAGSESVNVFGCGGGLSIGGFNDIHLGGPFGLVGVVVVLVALCYD